MGNLFSKSLQQPHSRTAAHAHGGKGRLLSKPNKHVSSSIGCSAHFSFAHASLQGWRLHMEDAHIQHVFSRPDCGFFAVLDGHSGAQIAIASQNHLVDVVAMHMPAHISDQTLPLPRVVETALRGAFLDHDMQMARDEVLLNSTAGSTCCSVYVNPEFVTFAHVGDSRALFVRNGAVIHATSDHKPYHEQEMRRICKAGGTVILNRLDGTLAVSRAFGDYRFKGRRDLSPTQQKVSAEPRIDTISRESSTFEFVLVACDGVWDVMSSEVAASFVYKLLTKKKTTAQHACEALVRRCLKLHSFDNISAIIVILNPPDHLTLKAVGNKTKKGKTRRHRDEVTADHGPYSVTGVPALGKNSLQREIIEISIEGVTIEEDQDRVEHEGSISTDQTMVNACVVQNEMSDLRQLEGFAARLVQRVMATAVLGVDAGQLLLTGSCWGANPRHEDVISV